MSRILSLVRERGAKVLREKAMRKNFPERRGKKRYRVPVTTHTVSPQ